MYITIPVELQPTIPLIVAFNLLWRVLSIKMCYPSQSIRPWNVECLYLKFVFVLHQSHVTITNGSFMGLIWISIFELFIENVIYKQVFGVYLNWQTLLISNCTIQTWFSSNLKRNSVLSNQEFTVRFFLSHTCIFTFCLCPVFLKPCKIMSDNSTHASV